MNSARRLKRVREQRREARWAFFTEVFGWSTMAAVTYMFWVGVFWMVSTPLSTIIS